MNIGMAALHRFNIGHAQVFFVFFSLHQNVQLLLWLNCVHLATVEIAGQNEICICDDQDQLQLIM